MPHSPGPSELPAIQLLDRLITHAEQHGLKVYHVGLDRLGGTRRLRPYRQRYIGEHMLLHVVSGQGLLTDGEQEHSIEAGTAVIFLHGSMPPWQLLPGAEVMQAFRWRFHVPGIDTRTTEPLQVHASPHLADLARLATERKRSEDGTHRSVVMRTSLLLTLSELALTQAGNAAGEAVPGLLTTLQRVELERYASEHLADRIDSADLAELLNMSRVHFRRLFKNSYGCGVRSWLLEHRMQHAAARLLRLHEPIGSLATALGYEEPALFSRHFRQILGCSPRQYRQSHAQEN